MDYLNDNVKLKVSDYMFHPPSGSNLPGTSEANPYMNYPPDEIKRLLGTEENKEEREKMKSALKEWGRIYVWPGYPYKVAFLLRKLAAEIQKRSEITPQPRNIPYYFDEEQPQGYGEILDSLRNVHDNDDMVRFDYPRQGERPVRNIDTGRGDFLAPSDPLFDAVKPRGDGPNPPGMGAEEPPTGGNISGLPSMLGR